MHSLLVKPALPLFSTFLKEVTTGFSPVSGPSSSSPRASFTDSSCSSLSRCLCFTFSRSCRNFSNSWKHTWRHEPIRIRNTMQGWKTVEKCENWEGHHYLKLLVAETLSVQVLLFQFDVLQIIDNKLINIHSNFEYWQTSFWIQKRQLH